MQRKKPQQFNVEALNFNPGSTYFSSSSPNKYHRRRRLNFRIRDGNGYFPTTISTRKFLYQT